MERKIGVTCGGTLADRPSEEFVSLAKVSDPSQAANSPLGFQKTQLAPIVSINTKPRSNGVSSATAQPS
jgi:hypothetical protein